MNVFSLTATLGLAIMPVAMILGAAPVHAILRAVGL
ncbi:MAG: hypothetical protein JWM33_3536 [Caulobacteraceae bacterium]|nr:hypothetical protein [Caulobacteraceae bacterium]MDB5441109.1 hypothetical protein [Caulobacteraceae bacterium]